MDYAKIHRRTAFFGMSLDDVADSRGLNDALGILRAAIDETVDRDLRQDRETVSALAFIRQLMGKVSAASDFEKALTIQHSGDRMVAVEAAFYRLRDVVWTGIEQQ